MLTNANKHNNCFCNSEGRIPAVELRKFANGEAGTADILEQEIVFVIKGSVDVAVADNGPRRQLRRGEFAFTPMGTRLSYKVQRNSVLLLVRIFGEVPECHAFRINKPSESTDIEERGIYALTINARMKQFIDGFLAVINDGLKCRLYMQNKMMEMLFLLHAYYTEEECVKFFSSIITPDMGFSEFVRMNYPKYQTVSEMAQALCVTPIQFSLRFKKAFRMTPREWMYQKKAKQIYQDICRSDKPLKDIAFEHGFSVSANFTRYCKKNFGTNPGNIRKTLGH